MRLLGYLNLSDLRDLSLRPELGAEERAAILMEWRARDLRARAVITLLLERWLLANPDRSFETFAAMHRRFQPWSGDDEAARASWQWWVEGRAAAAEQARRAGRPHGHAADRAWKVDAGDDRRPARGAGGLRDESAMHRLGYVVGEVHGLAATARRAVLDRFFTEALPPLVRAHYGDEYGEPWSEKRLRRMATLMAFNVERFRRHDARRFGPAVEAWTADLEYLRARYHDGWFAFPWPRVSGQPVVAMAPRDEVREEDMEPVGAA